MIKVIEGHKLKPGANIQPIFLKLRSNAMQYPGFIGAENLIGEEDASLAIFISTWNAAQNWRAWEISGIRTGIYREIEELLVEEPKITIYTIMPTHW